MARLWAHLRAASVPVLAQRFIDVPQNISCPVGDLLPIMVGSPVDFAFELGPFARAAREVVAALPLSLGTATRGLGAALPDHLAVHFHPNLFVDLHRVVPRGRAADRAGGPFRRLALLGGQRGVTARATHKRL